MTDFNKKDVLEVATELINNSIYYDCSDYNRADTYKCIYCEAEHQDDEELKHYIGCVTMIAQDLLTRSGDN